MAQATKRIPSCGSAFYLERPRVNKLLAEALRDGRPVSVRAGAGHGKTCAVAAFLRKQNAHTFWIQLTERDNTATRFWENFTRAIAVYNTRFTERLESLGLPETDADFERYRRVLAEERLFNKKVVVVFDDLHLVRNPAVLGFLGRGMRSPVPNFSCILISRTDEGENRCLAPSGRPFATVAEDDLRFTKDEAAEYFQRLGVAVPAEDLARIYKGTHGWAWALTLLGVALQKNPALGGYARAAMKSNVFKLLESEVFQVASQRLQRFLVRVSLLDYLPAALVLRLAGDPRLVRELDGMGCGVRRAERLGAYMLHPLFREYLQSKQGMLAETEVRETYLQAAAWCRDNDRKVDAIYYYGKVGEYAPIVQIVYTSSVQPSAALAETMVAIFDAAPPEAKMSDALFAAIHLCVKLSLGRLDEAFALGTRYRDEFEAMPETPFTDRALAGIYSALGYMRFLAAPATGVYDFDAYYKKQDEYYSRNPYPTTGLVTRATVGPWISMVGTDRPGAMREYIDALSRTVPHTVHAMGGNLSGMDVLARGELCFYRNELDAAEAYVAEALEASGKFRQHDIRNRALFYQLRIDFAKGDYPGVSETMLELEKQLDEPEYPLRVVTFDIVSGTYWLVLGQPQGVAAWLRTDFEESSLNDFVAVFGMMVQARYHFQSGCYQKMLEFVSSREKPGMVLFGRVEWAALEAVCRLRIKDGEGALAALRRGYGLALSNGVTMPFVEMGDDMRALADAALRGKDCGIPRPLLEDVRAGAAAYAENRRRCIQEYEEAHHAEGRIVLTPRENAVLEDLSFDLSRVEIAASRNLSIHAVRNALNSLFSKFDVGDIPGLLRAAKEKKVIVR